MGILSLFGCNKKDTSNRLKAEPDGVFIGHDTVNNAESGDNNTVVETIETRQQKIIRLLNYLENKGVEINYINKHRVYESVIFPNERITYGTGTGEFYKDILVIDLYKNIPNWYLERYLEYCKWYIDNQERYKKENEYVNPIIKKKLLEIHEPIKSDTSIRYNTVIGKDLGFMNLDESQLDFIKKCKIDGKMGCSITVNNQRVYISFYKNK